MKRILRRLLCLTLCGAFVLPAASCDSTKRALRDNTYANAGLELVLTVCEDYYSLDTHVLSGEPGGDGPSFVWPFASFLEALSEAYTLYPENETLKTYYVDALDNGIKKYRVTGSITTTTGKYSDITYYNSSAGNRGDYYYDDNAWICIQFIRAYELLGDEKYLTAAEELLAFFDTGIDPILGGGIYWDKSFSSKNTCSDGPVAISYLMAYRHTQKQEYLDTAKSIMEWLNATLRDSDGLYFDNISSQGEINGWKADYNQGTPLYALCMLYEFTGDEEYRTMADQTAQYALTLAFKTRGIKNPTATLNENPIYKAWCVGWLMRGFAQYVQMSQKAGRSYLFMEQVLDATLETKDAKGYYDPYFCSGGTGDGLTEVLQPSGVASVMLLCGYYDVYIAPGLKD